MSLLKPIAIAVIASLLATPVYAERPNPAAKLSLTPPATAPDRTPSKVRNGQRIGSTATLPLILVGAAVVIGAAVLLGDNDSMPASN